MFSQIDPDQERTEGGLGVGLALVKGLVELHGGHIEAYSDGIGLGSEFSASIPCVQGSAGALAGLERAQPGTPVREKPRQILVADDNQDGAESLAMLLRLFGYEVLVAHTGPDALALATEHRPQIAILDIGMPGLSGYDIARHIRQEVWGASVTLIAVTGWRQAEDRRKSKSAGKPP